MKGMDKFTPYTKKKISIARWMSTSYADFSGETGILNIFSLFPYISAY